MKVTRLLAAIGLAATPVLAQENYEIQVYPGATAKKGWTFVELHSNWTGSGTKLTEDGVFGTNHQLHETIEITRGLTDYFELGFYLFTAQRPGGGWNFVGTHIRPRVAIPEDWKWPVGLSLSTEFGPTRTGFDANKWGMELRPIVDQTIGPLYWSFNPNIEWALEGPDAGRGLDGMVFNPNLKLAWDVSSLVAAGVEYYGTVGTVRRLAPSAAQEHIIYPTLDLDFGTEWEFNVGYGIRLAGSGDHQIFKMIVGRRFAF